MVALTAPALYAQGVKLNITTWNPCDSSYTREFLATIIKDNQIFHASDTLGTFHLPEPGIYQLKLRFPELYTQADTFKNIFLNFGQNYDTLTRAAIAIAIDFHRAYWYMRCDEMCEGYDADFFDNGQKRIEGNFKKGVPVGKLVFYRPNGLIALIVHYDNEGRGVVEKREKF